MKRSSFSSRPLEIARAKHEAHLLDLALRRAEALASGLDPEWEVPADPIFDEDDYRPMYFTRWGR